MEVPSPQKNVRLLAFYLPQYHPVPENDVWWGKGFTEWANVARARPIFSGHYQPHVPADLGFYDLRLAETREAQAELAREYGIYGFVYYHYWFHGRRLLHRPLDEVLSSGRPDFPFCLCWANENWTRAWDGLDREVLLPQTYSNDDDLRHIHWLAKLFQDRRYIRINGRPMLLVYRASKLPNPCRTASVWREEARKLGTGEIFLARVESFPDEHQDPAQIGFDAGVEFQPDGSNIGPPLKIGPLWRLARRLGPNRTYHRLAHRLGLNRTYQRGNVIYDYGIVIERMLRKDRPSYKRFPCVMPSWDNTPRRANQAIIFKNSTPEAYGKWLRGTIERFLPSSPEENFVFINAWNEWGEGNHLEPCLKWGRAYLEATRGAL